MLDTIAKLDFKLNEANVLLAMYRENAIAAGLEEERMQKEIERLSNWHSPFHA
jgi:hypothetical protein